MNREQRRKKAKQGYAVSKEPVINIKTSDIQNIKNQAVHDATHKAFFLMLAIPVMVMHDKYPKLMKKEVDGKSREERFADMCIDLYDSFERDYVTLEDLADCLWEEAGIKLEPRRKE